MLFRALSHKNTLYQVEWCSDNSVIVRKCDTSKNKYCYSCDFFFNISKLYHFLKFTKMITFFFFFIAFSFLFCFLQTSFRQIGIRKLISIFYIYFSEGNYFRPSYFLVNNLWVFPLALRETAKLYQSKCQAKYFVTSITVIIRSEQ